MSSSSSKIYLVTGASGGLGLALAEVALKTGHKVIATARNVSKAAQDHPQIEKLGGQWLQLDVNKVETQKTVEEAVQKLGKIDVLINNAGYSLLGSIEDMSEEELHDQMETNYFGAIRVMKGVLPTMRKQKSGTIVNITSIAGLDGRPSSGVYAASKFALEGLSEGLSHELAPFNIRVLIVEPGGFRTNFLGAYQEPAAGVTKDYEGTPLTATLTYFREYNGKQPGDPTKAAQRIVEVIDGTGMAAGQPQLLRLPLGKDCLQRANRKVESLASNLKTMEAIASSTDFDE